MQFGSLYNEDFLQYDNLTDAKDIYCDSVRLVILKEDGMILMAEEDRN